MSFSNNFNPKIYENKKLFYLSDANNKMADRRKPTPSTSEDKPQDTDKQFLGRMFEYFMNLSCLW